MRILKWVLAFILILLVAAGLTGYYFLKSSRPVYNGEVPLPGLKDLVKVHYDNFGIPHIYASNEEDLYYALGYVHAQDRLFQMELLRRVGGGRLSEIFGPELIETDKFLRTIGINDIAEQSAQVYLSDDTEPFQKAAIAYINGINAFVKLGPTPPEFVVMGIPKEEFTLADIYRAVGYIGFNFNTAVRTDPLLTGILSNLGPHYFKDLVINTTKENTTIPTFMTDTSSISQIAGMTLEVLGSLPLPGWMGSNSWVVSGRKTESGYPILANDAHIGFSQPSVWYEAHLNSPGFNFYGNHLAGFPFALIGHNQYSAWGLTIFPNDDMDFFREKVNPENHHQVWNKDHWENLETREEVIKVKGASDYIFKVRSSRHGPIINEVNEVIDSLESQPVSFFWTYGKFPNKALQTAYGMAHSSSLDEFTEAISLLEAPGLNVTYADKDGNIAWWAVARLIERPDHVEPKLILDGASGLDDPTGWYPFEENPRSINPPEGFVYSANNQPDSAHGVFHPGYYYPGQRGQRIIELLTPKNDWDLESFKVMLLDDVSATFPQDAGRIMALITRDLTDSEEQVASILSSWNGGHQLQDTGPTIFYYLTNQIQKNTFSDELGEASYQVYSTTLVARRTLSYLLENDSSRWWDNLNTPELETRTQIINQSFSETISELTEAFGPDPLQWHWGNVHILEHGHLLGNRKPLDRLFNVGPFPVSGGDEVINKMDFNKTSIPYRVRSGPSMRILIDLADMENSLSVIPTGQSGHLMSPHYQDQAKLYNSGNFRPQSMMGERSIPQEDRWLYLRPLEIAD